MLFSQEVLFQKLFLASNSTVRFTFVFILSVMLLAGCKQWTDLSYGQRLLIVKPEIVMGTAELAGEGITGFSECVIELKEKALDESKYRGFVECSPK